MFCPKCGCNMENSTKFCTECGADLTVAQPTPPPVQPSPPPPATYTTQHQHNYQTPQRGYPQYQVQHPSNAFLDKPLTTWQYVGMFLLCGIPIVGIILLFIWAFGDSVNTNKKNYARAILIMALIGIVISILLSALFGAIFTSVYRYSTSYGM